MHTTYTQDNTKLIDITYLAERSGRIKIPARISLSALRRFEFTSQILKLFWDYAEQLNLRAETKTGANGQDIVFTVQSDALPQVFTGTLEVDEKGGPILIIRSR